MDFFSSFFKKNLKETPYPSTSDRYWHYDRFSRVPRNRMLTVNRTGNYVIKVQVQQFTSLPVQEVIKQRQTILTSWQADSSKVWTQNELTRFSINSTLRFVASEPNNKSLLFNPLIKPAWKLPFSSRERSYPTCKGILGMPQENINNSFKYWIECDRLNPPKKIK